MMGGHIWVESQEGVGSTFSFLSRFQEFNTLQPGPAAAMKMSPPNVTVILSSSTLFLQCCEAWLNLWGAFHVAIGCFFIVFSLLLLLLLMVHPFRLCGNRCSCQRDRGGACEPDFVDFANRR